MRFVPYTDAPMRLFVAFTDWDWYRHLASRPEVGLVNFWRPRAQATFRVLAPGDLLLFKLKAPRRAIAGVGQFQEYRRLPIHLMWEVFGEGNGASNLEDLEMRIRPLQGSTPLGRTQELGCVILRWTIMFPPDDWIPEPPDWRDGSQQGKHYDTDSEVGQHLWVQVQERLQAASFKAEPIGDAVGDELPVQFVRREVSQRQGQDAFRLLITTAYQNRCAFTRERVLPALEAGHIRPATRGGSHAISNGMLLRRDVHALFDTGYLGVHPRTLQLQASARLQDDFQNGHEYREMQGQELWCPPAALERPSRLQLEWHMDQVFRH